MSFAAGDVRVLLGAAFNPAGFAAYEAATKRSIVHAREAEAAIETSAARQSSAMVAGSAAAAKSGRGTALAMGAAKAASKGAVGIAIIAGAAIVKSISAASKFETSLNVMQQASKATDGQMKQVSATALKLGADAKLPATSAKDAADAMTELAKGGLSAQEAMDAARGTLELSAAAQISNADAAGITADALNAFGLKAKDAGMVSDLLAASANATTASMPQMADALKQSSAVAAQMHVPIGTTVAALGQLANAGIKGSDAGTSLKTMLLSLAAPSKVAQKTMKNLGFSAYDSTGKFKPFERQVADLTKATAKLSPAQRNAALSTIFGSDAIRAASVFLKQGVKGHRDMKRAVEQTGAAQKAAEARSKGLGGAMNNFASTIQTLEIQLGTALLPTATKFITWLSRMAAQAPAAFEALRSAAQPVIEWFGANVGPVIEHVAALWDQHGAKITAIATRVFSGIAAIVGPFLQAFRSLNEALLAALAGDWSRAGAALRAAASFAWTAVQAAFTQGVAAVKAIAQAAWPLIVQGARAAWAALPGIVSGAVSLIGQALRALPGIIGPAISSAASAIAANAPGVLAAAGTLALDIITAVGNGLVDLASTVGGYITDIDVASAGSAAVDAAAGLAGDILSAIVDGLVGLGSAITSKIASELASINFPTPHISTTTIGGVTVPNGIHFGADGMIVDAATLAVIGEAGKEVLIPVSPGKRQRGLALLGVAAAELGVPMLGNGARSRGTRRRQRRGGWRNTGNWWGKDTDPNGKPPKARAAHQRIMDGLDARIALSELTPSKRDDLAAYRALERQLSGDLAYTRRHHAPPSVVADIARGLKSARDTISGLTAPSDTMTALRQAQVDRANQRASTAGMRAALAESLLAAGAGGLGLVANGRQRRQTGMEAQVIGSTTASGVLGGGITINTLHPGDPATLRAIADASNRGQRMGRSTRSPRVRV